MSGIMEWQNAVCLFVNVDSSSYPNIFYQDGTGAEFFFLLHRFLNSFRIANDVVCATTSHRTVTNRATSVVGEGDTSDRKVREGTSLDLCQPYRSMIGGDEKTRPQGG